MLFLDYYMNWGRSKFQSCYECIDSLISTVEKNSIQMNENNLNNKYLDGFQILEAVLFSH